MISKLAWGLLGGGAAAWLHFWFLRRALERIRDLAPRQAKRQIMRGLPLRMMPWVLLAAILAPKGWPAVIAALASLAVVRWLTCRNRLNQENRDQQLLIAD